jgi:hypothetical protein
MEGMEGMEGRASLFCVYLCLFCVYPCPSLSIPVYLSSIPLFSISSPSFSPFVCPDDDLTLFLCCSCVVLVLFLCCSCVARLLWWFGGLVDLLCCLLDSLLWSLGSVDALCWFVLSYLRLTYLDLAYLDLTYLDLTWLRWACRETICTFLWCLRGRELCCTFLCRYMLCVVCVGCVLGVCWVCVGCVLGVCWVCVGVDCEQRCVSPFVCTEQGGSGCGCRWRRVEARGGRARELTSWVVDLLLESLGFAFRCCPPNPALVWGLG